MTVRGLNTLMMAAVMGVGMPFTLSFVVDQDPKLAHPKSGEYSLEFFHAVFTMLPKLLMILGILVGIVGAAQVAYGVATHSVGYSPRVSPPLRHSSAGEEVEPPASPEPTNVWENAIMRHDALKDSYAEIVCDPVAALEHTALFDVANPKTAAFIDIFGKCQDLRSIYSPQGQEPDRPIVEDFAASVRRASLLWEDARRYATVVGNEWLPVQEQSAAHKAVALLKVSRDNATTPQERSLAAQRAEEQLASITSFDLPKEARGVLESMRRPEVLPAAAGLTTQRMPSVQVGTLGE